MKFGQNAFVFWVPGFEFNFFYFFFFLLVYRGQLKLWVCEGGLKAVGGRGGRDEGLSGKFAPEEVR